MILGVGTDLALGRPIGRTLVEVRAGRSGQIADQRHLQIILIAGTD